MKRFALFLLLAVSLLAGCSKVDTPANHESVLIDKPLIFGKGGVRDETFKTSLQWTWATTDHEPINMNPFTVNETFDDLTTSEGSYVDFSTTLTLQVTDAVQVYKLGSKWYENNLQRPYQEIMRQQVRKYTLSQLRTDVATQDAIDRDVMAATTALIKELKLPARVVSVNLGKAKPNAEVQAQINQTTAQQQRKLTMEDFRKAEDARAEAEKSRAKADNAYREAMGLNPDMFIRLEQVKRFAEACAAPGSNCTVINGVSNPVVLGK